MLLEQDNSGQRKGKREGKKEEGGRGRKKWGLQDTERMRTSELGAGSRLKSYSNGVSKENLMESIPDCSPCYPFSIKTLTTAMWDQ